MTNGVRVKLDLSSLLSGPDRYRWIYLPYDKFQTIGDVKDYLSTEYHLLCSNFRLFLGKPFLLPNSESIKLLEAGDLIIISLEQSECEENQKDDVKKGNDESINSDSEQGVQPVSQTNVKCEMLSKKRRKRKRAVQKLRCILEEKVTVDCEKSSLATIAASQEQKNVSPPVKRKKTANEGRRSEENCLQKLNQCDTISCEDSLLSKTDIQSNFKSLLNLASGTAFTRKLKSSLLDDDKSYSIFPTLTDLPKVGQLIAFRMLELDSEYSPVLSNFKEGLVISINKRMVSFQLQKGYEISRTEGKFDICAVQNNEQDTNRGIDVDWSNVNVAKLIK